MSVLTIGQFEPHTRRCESCGYRFRPDGAERFCSATCAGAAGIAAVIASVQRFARDQAVRLAGGQEAQGQGASGTLRR